LRNFLRQVDRVDLAHSPLPQLLGQVPLESFHAFAIQRAKGQAMAWHMRRLMFLRYFAQRVVTPHIGEVDMAWMTELISKTTQKERKER
jgi:hypothetical protein